MEDDASILLDGKTLANLRVVDLKLELEKRGLSKSGSKKDLVKRLKQQLEFEKLSSERKSTGDCDLKLELDADTEQNEFVQQYLAQQQKIYAEQKEVKRRVEEEIQRSGDEKESCDSAKDDDKTEDEAETTTPSSVTESFLPYKHSKNKRDDSDEVFEAKEDTLSPPSVPQDPKNAEEARRKQLSTAISSLLSVEKTENIAEDNQVCNEEIALVETTRPTHDDDREKDLATAVLSSLLVNDQDEPEAKEVTQEEVTYHANEDPVVNNLEILSKDSATTNDDASMPACNTTEASSELSVESNVQPSQLIVHGLETKAKDAGSEIVETGSQNLDVQPTQLTVDPDISSSETESKEFKTKHAEAAASVEDASKPREASSQLKVESNVLGLETKHKDTEACKVENLTVIVNARQSKDSEVVESELKCEDVNTGLLVVKSCEKDAVAAKLDVQSVARDVDSAIVVSDFDDNKATAKSSEITQSLAPEMSAKMDVSSVPYSLAEIQLPESPGKAVKPQTKMQIPNESIETTEPEKDVQNNMNSGKKLKISESEDLNGKDNASKEDQGLSLAKVGEDSVDMPKSPLKKELDKTSRRVKDSEGKKSKRNHSSSDSGSENDAKSRRSKRKGHDRKKRYDSSDDDRSPLKKSSKKHKDRKSDSSRDRSKSPRKDSEKSSRRNRKRSISSEDERSSRTRSKKSSPKRESRKKRDRRHRSSSSEEDRFRSLKEGSPKKRRGHSDDERPSKTRSRSPKKSVKDKTSKRFRGNHSSEDERSSKTRSKSPKTSGKESSSKNIDKDQTSEDEQVSNARSKSPNKMIEESGSKSIHVEHSSENSQHLKAESKSSKDIIQDSSQKQNSGKSDNSEDEQPSRIQESPARAESKREQSRSSEKEQHSRTHSKESSRKETRTSHKEKELKDEAQDLDVESKKTSASKADDEHSKKDIHVECKPKEVKSMEETVSVKPVKSRNSRDRSPRSPLREKERGKSSSRSRSPGNAKSYSATLELKSGSESKDPDKRDKSGSSTPESDSRVELKDTHLEKQSIHKDKLSPKKISEEAPKAALPEAVPEKSNQKTDVSEGELTSSRENSPYRKEKIVVIRRPSANSDVPIEGTMTVIRKETPKQRIKIKRDNVVVVKKEEEKLPEKEPSKTVDSVSKDPEPAEEQKLEPGECPEAVPYVSSRKITLSNRKRTEKPADEPTGKRSKWGSFAASRNKGKQVSISTDSLKNWFPDFKLLKEPPVIEPVPEEPTSPTEEPNVVEMEAKKDIEELKVTIPPRKTERSPSAEEKPLTKEPIQLDDEGVTPSQILFIRNLVRPFTLLQLKELLKETGNMVEDKFWIDKIKSKCFVTYETEEDAIKTRSVLNGARWPVSNPKILAVDFATEEDLEYHRSGAVDQPKPRPQSPPPIQPSLPRQEEEPRDRRPTERESRRERASHLPMREWDKDKVTQDSPEKLDRRRGDDGKGPDKEKKEKRARVGLEETPAKLLDDLFQKTKATPCIYWLPLTQEQIKAKAEQARMDRERRHQEQENKRPRSKQRTRETDTRRSSTRSRSPVTRRR